MKALVIIQKFLKVFLILFRWATLVKFFIFDEVSDLFLLAEYCRVLPFLSIVILLIIIIVDVYSTVNRLSMLVGFNFPLGSLLVVVQPLEEPDPILLLQGVVVELQARQPLRGVQVDRKTSYQVIFGQNRPYP